MNLAATVGWRIPHRLASPPLAGAFDPSAIRAPNYWVFSNSNRSGVFTDPGGNFGAFGNHNIRSLQGHTDKRYFEFVYSVNAGNIIGGVVVGVGLDSYDLGSLPGQAAGSISYRNRDGRVLLAGGPVLLYATWATGDVIGMAIDGTNGKVWFSKNNDWNGGDPATGTGEAGALSLGTFKAMVAGDNINTAGTGNPLILYAGTGNFTLGTDAFAPPAGFKAWDAP